jgi:hypothetical protein
MVDFIRKALRVHIHMNIFIYFDIGKPPWKLMWYIDSMPSGDSVNNSHCYAIGE